MRNRVSHLDINKTFDFQGRKCHFALFLNALYDFMKAFPNCLQKCCGSIRAKVREYVSNRTIIELSVLDNQETFLQLMIFKIVVIFKSKH